MRVEWNGGKLTTKRAAFLCAEMWQWIADTLTQKVWDSNDICRIKRSWPEWIFNGGKVKASDGSCFACEKNDGYCEKCFLFDLWPNGCGQENSPYKELSERDIKTARAAKKRAQKIADAARKVYEECK